MLDRDRPDVFLSLSAALTGFTNQELTATGSTSIYLRWLSAEFPTLFTELLERWDEIERDDKDPKSRERTLHQRVLGDPRFDPFARNIALLWYTATWSELPGSWALANDQPTVHSRGFDRTYAESLVWKAAGTHPIGANPTGFGGWALPPPAPGIHPGQ